MKVWVDRVSEAAAALGVGVAELQALLKVAGIDASTVNEAAPEDLRTSWAQTTELRGKSEPANLKLKIALKALQGEVKGASLSSLSVEQLIRDLRLDDADDPSAKELLDREVRGKAQNKAKKFRDTRFLVLGRDRRLNVDATVAVVEAIQRGVPERGDGTVEVGGAHHVVFSYSELPTPVSGYVEYVDPLFPSEVLVGGYTAHTKNPKKNFGVLVRGDGAIPNGPTGDEAHRLMLFLRLNGHLDEPTSAQRCKELVAKFAAATSEDALEALAEEVNAKGPYYRAKLYPGGSHSLPEIVKKK